MRALGINDYGDYLKYLEREPVELQELLKTIPINLSYFYRNPEVFEYFQTEVIPKILTRGPLSFWSAGCASGEEVYSIVIAILETLGEKAGFHRPMIYGTDVDQEAIEQARRGVYSRYALAYMPSELVGRYFNKKDGSYEIVPRLKKYVDLSCTDLFRPPAFGPVNVIFCRNVLIYFAKEAQRQLIRIFYDALKREGFLILGKVEVLLGIDGFRVVNTRERVYQKVI